MRTFDRVLIGFGLAANVAAIVHIILVLIG